MPHMLRAVRFETRSSVGWNIRWDVKKFRVNLHFLILDAGRKTSLGCVMEQSLHRELLLSHVCHNEGVPGGVL